MFNAAFFYVFPPVFFLVGVKIEIAFKFAYIFYIFELC